MSSSFTHYSLLHLLFNMASLWGYGFLEQLYGHVGYAKYSFLLLVLSFVVQMLVYKTLIACWNMQYYRDMLAIGYSCVVFGFMTLGSLVNPTGVVYILAIPVPMIVIPFMSLALTQWLIPNASFIVCYGQLGLIDF